MLEEKRKFSSSSEDHLVSNTFFSFSGKVLSTAFHHPALLLGWLWWRMKCCPPSFALRRENRNPLEDQSSLPPCPIIFGPHYSPSLSSPHLGRRRGAENTSYILPSGRKGKQLDMTGYDTMVALFSLHHLWGRECRAPSAVGRSWVEQA